jgi:hypothetical protein
MCKCEVSPEQRLDEAIRRLQEHRAAVKAKGFATPADLMKERRLVRAYRREVENGC